MTTPRVASHATGKKLPARYQGVITPLVLSIFMSFIVSGISTVKSVGFNTDALTTWMGAWGVSWAIAFPALFIVLPLVRRIVAAFVHAPRQ